MSFGIIKPKYKEKAKLCDMDTDSPVFHIKIHSDIAKDVRFDTLIYELDRP